jgi:alkanesulfonate monooxygenase SsuD/methylene tetrahydromethanopterin reductase-like flavin-dependent oxidoreductase (luciferase family)
MKVSLFYLPSVGNKAQVEQGMVGLRGELYDQMLREVSAQARLADDLGYDSISFTEHHFHAEGFELSNNPVLLDLYIAMQTKRLRVGQLGIVLPANNPIRVAEDIAMLDHMTGGRANAGFARGYQRRWVDIMAQQTHGIHGAQPHQHDEIDAANRAAFEECFRIIKAAWTQDLLSYQGKYWRVPPGETPWPIEATAKWGERRRGRHRQGRERGAEARAEAASADLPALRVLRTQHPMVRAGGRDRGDSAALPGL